MPYENVSVEEIIKLKQALKRTLDMAPAARVLFLWSLTLFHRTGDFFFALAGTRPSVLLLQKAEDNLLWI